MATTAMVKKSMMKDWFGWWNSNGVRFCQGGHRVHAGDLASFPADHCPHCESTRFVYLLGRTGDEAVPVPLNPIRTIRKWHPVDAYDKDGKRLVGVRQRVKIPVFDVSAIPAGSWE